MTRKFHFFPPANHVMTLTLTSWKFNFLWKPGLIFSSRSWKWPFHADVLQRNERVDIGKQAKGQLATPENHLQEFHFWFLCVFHQMSCLLSPTQNKTPAPNWLVFHRIVDDYAKRETNRFCVVVSRCRFIIVVDYLKDRKVLFRSLHNETERCDSNEISPKAPRSRRCLQYEMTQSPDNEAHKSLELSDTCSSLAVMETWNIFKPDASRIRLRAQNR